MLLDVSEVSREAAVVWASTDAFGSSSTGTAAKKIHPTGVDGEVCGDAALDVVELAVALPLGAACEGVGEE